MEPNKRGFYDRKTVMESGLPVVDFEADQDCYCEISWFTYTDMKNILKIQLTDYERQNFVAAFLKMNNAHGYTALYSFIDILTHRAGDRK